MTKASTALVFLLPAAVWPQVNVETVLDQVRTGVKPDEAMAYMREVYATDRWFSFPKFQQTAEYLKRAMTEAGLQNVEILGAPADGVTQFGFWTEPLAWEVKQARLELMGEDVPAEFRVLADYEKVPTSLGMWSGPTPPGGITAEIVEWNENGDMRGKLVLTKQNPANLKWDLVKKGVLGAINTFTENPELKDGRQWINAWGDSGWAFTKSSTPLALLFDHAAGSRVRAPTSGGRTERTRSCAGGNSLLPGRVPVCDGCDSGRRA